MPSVWEASPSLADICNIADVARVDGLTHRGYTTSDDVAISYQENLQSTRRVHLACAICLPLGGGGALSPPISGICIIATRGRAGGIPAPDAYEPGADTRRFDDVGRNAEEIAQ